MTATELFNRNKNTPSDIAEHLDYLYAIGSKCNRISEFGVRAGNSTSAWLACSPWKLTCYDWAVPGDLELFKEAAASTGTIFQFIQADTSKIEDIEECDLLFLDTLHTESHILAELKHAKKVTRYIVFHDTEINAWVGEGENQRGLKRGLIEFLLENTDWRIVAHFKNCNGLTVIERC